MAASTGSWAEGHSRSHSFVLVDDDYSLLIQTVGWQLVVHQNVLWLTIPCASSPRSQEVCLPVPLPKPSATPDPGI